MKNIVNIHVIEAFPPSNPNRDENGSPKSVIYGGVERRTLSSQSQKRAVKKRFNEASEGNTSYSSRQLIKVLAEELNRRNGGDEKSWTKYMDLATRAAFATGLVSASSLGTQKDKADKKAKEEASSTESDTNGEPETVVVDGVYLFTTDASFYFSSKLVPGIADIIERYENDLGFEIAFETVRAKTVVKNAAKLLAGERAKEIAAALKDLAMNDKSVPIGLFGRMSASTPTLNVDGAVQVSFALGLTEAHYQSDFYTAVDDFAQGSAMMGIVEFDSPVFYRHSNVDVDALLKYIGDREDTINGVVEYVESFINSTPSGAVRRFAHNSIPRTVIISINEQSISLSSAFFKTVDESNPTEEATSRLVRAIARINNVYGNTGASFGYTLEDVSGDEDVRFISYPKAIAELRQSLESSV